MSRASRLVLATVAALTVAAGCSGPNPYQAARDTTASTQAGSQAGAPGDTTGIGDNEFLPQRNVSDCVGTLERPDCGSKKKGGVQMYLVFAFLIAGVGFIMWRISIGVRARDKVVNAVAEPGAQPAPHAGGPDDASAQ